jgi:hypothetical protein
MESVEATLFRLRRRRSHLGNPSQELTGRPFDVVDLDACPRTLPIPLLSDQLRDRLAENTHI